MSDQRLTRLIARRDAVAKEREQAFDSRKAIVDIAEEEAREDLLPEEDAEHRALTAKIADFDKDLKGLDERIAELNDEATRSAQLSEGAAAVRRAEARARVTSESETYAKGNHRVSYMRDLMRNSLRMDDDGSAAERLARHAAEVRSNPEYRDLLRTDGNGGYFVPPAWLMSQYVDLVRGGRVTADLCFNGQLPSGTDSLNFPKISTGTTAVIQTADNGSVSETDMTDTSVAAGVKTIAGQQDIAVQLLDQSPISFDEVIFRDLLADYAKNLDIQVINGSNGSGQVKGILSAGGNAITYTDTTPTVGELYPKLADAVQQAANGSGTQPTVIVMHPRRWAWILTALDTTNRPLVVPSGPGLNQLATASGVKFQGLVGNLLGVDVYVDPNIPTNLGSGTNEDRILVMKADENYLYESSIRTRVLPEVGSGTLTVRLQVYGYLAFTAERRPLATSIIAGTGLVAPSF
jgi:HK97 family phage major capsid protein